jgi:hypothetical protein
MTRVAAVTHGTLILDQVKATAETLVLGVRRATVRRHLLQRPPRTGETVEGSPLAPPLPVEHGDVERELAASAVVVDLCRGRRPPLRLDPPAVCAETEPLPLDAAFSREHEHHLLRCRRCRTVLGRSRGPRGGNEAYERDAAMEARDPGSGPRLAFHKVPRPKHQEPVPSGPDHQRLRGRVRAPARARCDEAGRSRAWWSTYADVEGNEFDLTAGWSHPPPRTEDKT